MTTIAVTPSGWKATAYFIGKAKDWILSSENEHKNRAISADTEITQGNLKNFITNSNINEIEKKGVCNENFKTLLP